MGLRPIIRDKFHACFKVFLKLPEVQSNKGKSGKTLKIHVKLILNCPRALAITCLSHKGQNF